MPITYQVIGCSNPKGAEGVDYATNRAVKTGDCDFKQLAEDIQFALSPRQPNYFSYGFALSGWHIAVRERENGAFYLVLRFFMITFALRK